jgi:hypothetical protein
MAGKGPLDVVLDIPAINEIIVFANQYKQEVSEKADTIRTLCKQMTENESLNGGDGEEIKASFKEIAKGCNQLEQSVDHIVAVLNSKLDTMIKMNKGTTTGAASDEAKKASNSMGVLKE